MFSFVSDRHLQPVTADLIWHMKKKKRSFQLFIF